MIFELVQNFHNTTTVERVRRSARFEVGEGEIAGAGETDGVGEREKAEERKRGRASEREKRIGEGSTKKEREKRI